MPYAEKTQVPVDKTQGELRTLLRKSGADDIALYDAAERSMVAFKLGDFWYRLSLPRGEGKATDQKERAGWRLLLLLVKAKLEAVARGVTTVEREFFADMVMEGGATVYERAAPEIAKALREGRMPATLMLAGTK
jgi:hypothetical protein